VCKCAGEPKSARSRDARGRASFPEPQRGPEHTNAQINYKFKISSKYISALQQLPINIVKERQQRKESRNNISGLRGNRGISESRENLRTKKGSYDRGLFCLLYLPIDAGHAS
jgi:hypothetical protein